MGVMRAVYLSGLALSCACQGVIGSGGGDRSGDGAGTQAFICENPGEIALGTTPVRRLTNVEYDNTVRDLFGGDIPALPEQPSDAVLEGTFENDAFSLGPSDVRIARYEAAATTLGEHAVNDPTTRSRIIPCTSADASCGRQFVETFGKRAFRRPLTGEEVDRWAAYFESQRSGIDLDAALQLTIAGMLQAPHFLYRLENGGAGNNGHLELTQHAIASRLSYFLWESMPDDELMAAADANELSTEAELEAQARRMLEDGRATDTIRNFHRQWLYLERVLGEDKVADLFPMWSMQARDSAREESLRFIENTVFDGGTLSDLLTSNVAYVDDISAALYGVNAPGEPWSEVNLDPVERAGILSRIAFLAGNAHDANGSPPLRGVYVMERFLCEPRPSPPANADVSVPEADPNQGPMTNRQLFEQRTASAACQGCHVRIDGFGFGFEQYDAAGLFRTNDNGIPVDATGFANGIGNDAAYDGAIELQSLLAESEVVHNCVTRKWFTYAYGRAMEPADTCQVEALQEAFLESGGNIMELLVNIVSRPEFRLRSVVED